MARAEHAVESAGSSVPLRYRGESRSALALGLMLNLHCIRAIIGERRVTRRSQCRQGLRGRGGHLDQNGGRCRGERRSGRGSSLGLALSLGLQGQLAVFSAASPLLLGARRVRSQCRRGLRGRGGHLDQNGGRSRGERRSGRGSSLGLALSLGLQGQLAVFSAASPLLLGERRVRSQCRQGLRERRGRGGRSAGKAVEETRLRGRRRQQSSTGKSHGPGNSASDAYAETHSGASDAQRRRAHRVKRAGKRKGGSACRGGRVIAGRS